jgi:AraC-like DNA-binding protein
MGIENESVESGDLGVTCFSVNDLDEVNSAMGWYAEYVQLKPGEFNAQYSARELGDWGFLSERMHGAVQVRAAQPKGICAVILPIAQFGTAKLGTQPVSRRTAVFSRGGEELEFVATDTTENDTFWLAEDDFDERVRCLVPNMGAIGAIDVFSGKSDGLTRIARKIREGYGERAAAVESASMIFDELIIWLAETRGVEDTDNRAARNALACDARRVREHLEEHLDEKIVLRKLCEQQGIGLRTLQRRFAEYYGVTPLEYIRAQRLNRAHRLLAASGPESLTVSDAAFRCGYSHLGRFSSDYKTYFLETPVKTLRRKS